MSDDVIWSVSYSRLALRQKTWHFSIPERFSTQTRLWSISVVNLQIKIFVWKEVLPWKYTHLTENSWTARGVTAELHENWTFALHRTRVGRNFLSIIIPWLNKVTYLLTYLFKAIPLFCTCFVLRITSIAYNIANFNGGGDFPQSPEKKR